LKRKIIKLECDEVRQKVKFKKALGFLGSQLSLVTLSKPIQEYDGEESSPTKRPPVLVIKMSKIITDQSDSIVTKNSRLIRIFKESVVPAYFDAQPLH